MSSLADLFRRRRRRKVEVDTNLRLWEKPSLAPIEVGCRKFRRQTSAPPSDSAVLVRLFQASTVLHVMCYPIPVFLDRSESSGEFWAAGRGDRERKGWEKSDGKATNQERARDGRRKDIGDGNRLKEAVHRE